MDYLTCLDKIFVWIHPPPPPPPCCTGCLTVCKKEPTVHVCPFTLLPKNLCQWQREVIRTIKGNVAFTTSFGRQKMTKH